MLNPVSLHYPASQAILALYKFENSAEPDGAKAMLWGQHCDETLIFSAMFYLTTLQLHSGVENMYPPEMILWPWHGSQDALFVL